MIVSRQTHRSAAARTRGFTDALFLGSSEGIALRGPRWATYRWRQPTTLGRRQPAAAAPRPASLVILAAGAVLSNWTCWLRRGQRASRITRPTGRVAAAVGGLRPNLVGCRQRYVAQRGPRSAMRSQRPGKRATAKPRACAAADRCVWRDTILNWPFSFSTRCCTISAAGANGAHDP